MNVAKNWALTIMFSSFSIRSFLERTVVERANDYPVKKMLNNAGHIDTKLIDISEISPPKSSEIGCFLLIVSWRGFPPKFPVKSADFSKNLPLKILRNLTFFRDNPAKLADFSANLPLKIREILLFFPRNIRSPD